MPKPNRLRTTLSLFALAASLPFFAAPLSAQKSTTRGLHLGFHLQGASLTVENSDAANGGGAGVRVGYGFNRIFTLYLEADAISVDAGDPDNLSGTWNMGHGEIGARFHFANSLRSWVPYLEVAAGTRVVSVDDAEVGNQNAGSVDFSGGAVTFGGGLYAYFTETVALEVGLKVSSGEFTKIDIGSISVDGLDIDAQSARFKVGVVWWP